MSLIKKRVQDKIEIVGPHKTIQIRYANQILENGIVISESFHRESIECGNEAKAIEHNVKAIADTYWTDEIKEDYQRSLEDSIA
jgi:hypothetical protein